MSNPKLITRTSIVLDNNESPPVLRHFDRNGTEFLKIELSADASVTATRFSPDPVKVRQLPQVNGLVLKSGNMETVSYCPECDLFLPDQGKRAHHDHYTETHDLHPIAALDEMLVWQVQGMKVQNSARKKVKAGETVIGPEGRA